MGVIELSAAEVSKYRDACDRDSAMQGAQIPHEASDLAIRILRSRGIDGYPEKITVTFRHETAPHLYELFYSESAS